MTIELACYSLFLVIAGVWLIVSNVRAGRKRRRFSPKDLEKWQ